MTRMKRSQLKELIKECLVEILRDDVLLQHATSGAVMEMNQRRQQMIAQPMQQVQQQMMPPQFINPMDDQAMVQRQQAMMQRNQLMRQSNTMNRSQQPNTSNLSQMAGLDEGFDAPQGRNRADTGVRNPSDYLYLAAEKQYRFDPRPDAPLPGSPPRQRMAQQQQPQRRQQQQASDIPIHDMGGRVPEVSPDVLRSIFDDPSTQQTMHEQAQKGHVHHGRVDDSMNGGGMHAVGGDRFDMVTAQHDPEELFPDSASRWANLAF